MYLLRLTILIPNAGHTRLVIWDLYAVLTPFAYSNSTIYSILGIFSNPCAHSSPVPNFVHCFPNSYIYSDVLILLSGKTSGNDEEIEIFPIDEYIF